MFEMVEGIFFRTPRIRMRRGGESSRDISVHYDRSTFLHTPRELIQSKATQPWLPHAAENTGSKA